MPEEIQVTLTVNDDGTIDIGKFKDDPNLNKVKGVIDGLRRESAGYRTRISELEPQVGELESLKAQVAEWSGKVAMTPEEKAAFEKAQADLEAFKDLDPQAAREALQFKQGYERDQALSRAFKAAGFDPDAALELNGVRDLETRLVEAEGKQVAQVKQGDEWKPLEAFVGQRYERFLDILKPQAPGPAPTRGSGGRVPTGKLDVRGMPKDDFEALQQRALQGERITLT